MSILGSTSSISGAFFFSSSSYSFLSDVNKGNLCADPAKFKTTYLSQLCVIKLNVYMTGTTWISVVDSYF